MVNDFAFPTASVIQFQYAARADMPALDVFWYDGGMQPRIPNWTPTRRRWAPGGMLWVGDKGKILTGRPGRSATDHRQRERTPVDRGGAPQGAGRAQAGCGQAAWPPPTFWVLGLQGRRAFAGKFPQRGPDFGDRLPGRGGFAGGASKSGVRVYPAPVKLLYDSASMKITNLPEANKYLTRDYRPGWEL